MCGIVSRGEREEGTPSTRGSEGVRIALAHARARERGSPLGGATRNIPETEKEKVITRQTPSRKKEKEKERERGGEERRGKEGSEGAGEKM